MDWTQVRMRTMCSPSLCLRSSTKPSTWALTFIKYLLWTWHCAKCFRYVISHRCAWEGNPATEKLRRLPKDTQLVNGRARIWTQAVWLQNPILCITTSRCLIMQIVWNDFLLSMLHFRYESLLVSTKILTLYLADPADPQHRFIVLTFDYENRSLRSVTYSSLWYHWGMDQNRSAVRLDGGILFSSHLFGALSDQMLVDLDSQMQPLWLQH